ncbi:MAG TPA: hypothetical protein VM008_05625 [Phycisphaerae bacterium]|nr:hypothetical protein [Phycisphaerae bacterium]
MDWRIGSALVMMLAVGGCCHVIQPPPAPRGDLPAAISIEQQIAKLNARAVLLPRFRAHADDGGVQIILPNKEGKPETSPAGSGTLLVEQTYATHGAKLLLSVRYELKDIFDLGRNEQVWWAIERGQEQRAWMGPAARAGVEREMAATLREGKGADPKLFEALSAEIPELLGVTEIAPDSGESIVMRVDDERGVNDLIFVRQSAPGSDGTATMEKEIVVDRRTGEVREVDLYLPNGELLARATLSDYQPVRYKAGGGVSPPVGEAVPMMPRGVILDYPARRARLGMSLSVVEVPARFSEEAFTVPDWKEEGVVPEVVR